MRPTDRRSLRGVALPLLVCCAMAVPPAHAGSLVPAEDLAAAPGQAEPPLPGAADEDPASLPFGDAGHPPPLLSSREAQDRSWSRRNLFKRVLSDQKFLVTTWWPADLGRPGLGASVLATTAVALASNGDEGGPHFDQRLEGDLHGRTHGTAHSVAATLTELGNGLPAAFALGTSYLVGRWTGNERLAEASSLAGEALIDSGIWVTSLKQVFARTRPSGTGSGAFFRYNVPPGQTGGSFPSGHAMGAFTVASVFAHVYSEKHWLAWTFYGSAAAVATSRVALGRHFPTDVIVGGVLGNSIGRMVVARQAGERSRQRSDFPLDLHPIFDPKQRTWGVDYSHAW